MARIPSLDGNVAAEVITRSAGECLPLKRLDAVEKMNQSGQIQVKIRTKAPPVVSSTEHLRARCEQSHFPDTRLWVVVNVTAKRRQDVNRVDAVSNQTRERD